VGLVIGLVLFAVVAVAGIAVAGLFVVPKLLRGRGVLPFEPERLPKTTKKIVKMTYASLLQVETGVASSLVSEEAVWSQVAQEPCDGPDLHQAFMKVSEDPDKAPEIRLQAIAEALGPKLVPTQMALRCGRDISKDSELAPTVPTWFVHFAVGERDHSVQVIRATREKMPETDPAFDKRSFRERRGACKPQMKKDEKGTEHPEKCTDDSQAIAMTESLWFHGDLGQLDAFMRMYDRPADELPVAADVLSALAPALDGYPISAVLTDRDAAAYLASGITEIAGFLGVSEVRSLPVTPVDRAKKSGDLLSTRIRGHGVGYVLADVESSFRARNAFLAKDEEGARSIVSELEDYRKEWRAHIENHAEEIGKPFQEKVKSLPDTHREYKEAMFDLLMRGIAKAEVGRSGLVAYLDMEPKAKDSEQKAMRAYLVARKQQAATASRIVRTLASGRDPEPADIEALGGKRLTERIAEARRGKGM
jgi:hypothetical protein